jgi:hypothetical protein
LGNRRCPLPGVIDTGTVFCRDHWAERDDAKASEAVLLRAEQEYENWRIKRDQALNKTKKKINDGY